MGRTVEDFSFEDDMTFWHLNREGLAAVGLVLAPIGNGVIMWT